MKLLDIDCGRCGKNIGKVESYIFQFVDDDLDFVGNDMILCLDCAK